MNWTRRRQTFRALLTGPHCLRPASVHDPLTARIAEDIGFEMGMLAGSTASLSVLAAPDLCAITLSEFADQAVRINRVVGFPLIVDADHGYGNALNVMRTVEELEIAGVACLTIEDTNLPAPFGDAPPEFIPVAEAAGKMKAAVAARQDPLTVIAGRTGLGKRDSLMAMIERAKTYAGTGVDALFMSGIKTREQMDAVAEAGLGLPLMLGATPLAAEPDYLAARGVRVALQGHHQVRAAVQAIHRTLKSLRDGVAPEDLDNLASEETMRRLTREADYARAAKGFLK
jgi:carboxyvinyl-carboxyphosphonate phosphorylmutase